MRSDDIQLIEKALEACPVVRRAVVHSCDGAMRGREITADVFVSAEALNGDRPSRERLSATHVSNWAQLYDHAYREPSQADRALDIRGWNSVVTGAAIPSAEMRDWADHTAERVIATRPRRVLDIGCGTGLVMFRLAAHCDTYLGTDASKLVIEQVERELERDANLRHVRLAHGSAHDLEGIDVGAFDTVIVNSVVQYFPTIEYLFDFIARVVESMAPQSVLFLGDVRCFRLLRLLHLSILAHDSASSVDPLDAALQRRVDSENELTVDPEFFYSLRATIPKISDVEIFLKRGRHQNELTRFRYDVFVHVNGDRHTTAPPVEWRSWSAVASIDGFIGVMRKNRAVGIREIPNARLSQAIRLLDRTALPRGGFPGSSVVREEGVEPETLWELSEQHGYRLELGYSHDRALGLMDALLRPKSQDVSRVFWPQLAAAPPKSIRCYSNDPLQRQVRRKLVAFLRSHLAANYPGLLVPDKFNLLEASP